MMKKQNIIPISFIVLIIFMFCTSSVSAQTVLYTRISSINKNYSSSYCGIRYEGNDFDATEFHFSIQLEIWNPSVSNVTVNTRNFGLFNTGFEAQFENETYLGLIFEIESPASNSYIITSGLLQVNYSIGIIILPENFTCLPFGIYTFWIEFDFDINAKYLHTYLQVNNSGEYYSNEELPSNWGATSSILNIITSSSIFGLALLTVLLYSKKSK